MTESNLQHDLSACCDGELAADASRFLLRRLDHDAELMEAWSRYQLIGASLRREQGRLASADFASRVMQAVEAEPALAKPQLSTGRRWLQWSVGGAIAASVAVAALVTTQPGGPTAAVPQVAQVQTAARDEHASMDATTDLAATTASAASQANAPVPVPAWLSGYSASRLSQRASATLGGLPSESLPAGLRSGNRASYPAINTGNGSYLILLDPKANTRRASAQ
ncbi:sigma-E factor negative regulatory protein [Frateuria aurantia]